MIGPSVVCLEYLAASERVRRHGASGVSRASPFGDLSHDVNLEIERLGRRDLCSVAPGDRAFLGPQERVERVAPIAGQAGHIPSPAAPTKVAIEPAELL